MPDIKQAKGFVDISFPIVLNHSSYNKKQLPKKKKNQKRRENRESKK